MTALGDYETLRCEVDDDGVATLTLHRPEALNAFDLTMARELERFFLTEARDDAEDGRRQVQDHTEQSTVGGLR